jgi:serine/threonine-protein kinase
MAQHYPWGMVKVLDMGLARYSDPFTGQAATHLTQVGSVMGTPEYIAPEQARDSHTSDIRADLYSLGCTLYFLLTGQPPFPKGTLTEKLLQHQCEVAEPVAQVRRQTMPAWQRPNGSARVSDETLLVPAPVEELLCRLLSKQPQERFQTPIELANELQTILKQLAAGTLAAEEDLETTAVLEIVRPSAASVAEPIVLLAKKPAASFATGKLVALLAATLGGLACVVLVTVLAVLMSARAPIHANPKAGEPKPKQKTGDDKPRR